MLIRRMVYLKCTEKQYPCYWNETAWFTMATAEQIAKDINGKGKVLFYDEKNDSYIFKNSMKNTEKEYKGKIFAEFPSPLYPVGDDWDDWCFPIEKQENGGEK